MTAPTGKKKTEFIKQPETESGISEIPLSAGGENIEKQGESVGNADRKIKIEKTFAALFGDTLYQCLHIRRRICNRYIYEAEIRR